MVTRATGLVLALGLACGCSAPPAPTAADATPHRIVVVAPAAAELLEAFGVLDRVVGIGDFVDRPLRIAGLPRVGAYDTPNVERVLELHADLLVTASSRAADAAHERLGALGVPVLALDTSTYAGVFESIAEMGRRLGMESQAQTIEQDIRKRLEAVRHRSAGLPRRKVLVVVGRDPLYVAGPGSHIDEMIVIAGGENVAADTGAPYARMSMEAILERMPEVIIDASDNRPGAVRGRQPGAWAEWGFLPAVRDGRVWWVDPSRLTIPGVRLPEMTRLTSRLIHPETLGEPAPGELERL
jgi:iron complex transport system substrate-binding protein